MCLWGNLENQWSTRLQVSVGFFFQGRRMWGQDEWKHHLGSRYTPLPPWQRWGWGNRRTPAAASLPEGSFCCYCHGFGFPILAFGCGLTPGALLGLNSVLSEGFPDSLLQWLLWLITWLHSYNRTHAWFCFSRAPCCVTQVTVGVGSGESISVYLAGTRHSKSHHSNSTGVVTVTGLGRWLFAWHLGSETSLVLAWPTGCFWNEGHTGTKN